MKAILLSIFVFHASSFALDMWSFTLNSTPIECGGLPLARFWYCSGGIYEGIIDRAPHDQEMPFLPLFIDHNNAAVLNSEIDSWTNQFGDELYIGPFDISYRDYFFLRDNDDIEKELQNIEGNPSSQFYTTEDHTKITEISTLFFQSLRDFFISLKSQHIIQVIRQNRQILSTDFILTDLERTQRENNIKLVGRNQLSINNIINHEAIIVGGGIKPSYETALILFKEIVNYPDIPFSYTKDGCYARAHVIAARLHAQGIHTGKIWLAGDLINPYMPGKYWKFHVAPIIHVSGIDGEDLVYVIEPAMNKEKLLTIEEWLIGNKIQNPTLVAFPLPEKSNFFAHVVMAYSSYLPLGPYRYNGSKNHLTTLKEAEEINEKHSKCIQHLK